MRHLKRTAKLGRTGEHRNAMLANLVCSLIKHKRVTTTLAKAKAARSVAEKLVTLGKKDTVHARRLVAARLHQEDATKILFAEIAPAQKDRNGGYTRIVKLGGTVGKYAGHRQGDAADMAILEWVDIATVTETPVAEKPAAETKPAEEPQEEKAEKKGKKKKEEAAEAKA
jgi:large subunit ribosomal protein L17